MALLGLNGSGSHAAEDDFWRDAPTRRGSHSRQYCGSVEVGMVSTDLTGRDNVYSTVRFGYVKEGEAFLIRLWIF